MRLIRRSRLLISVLLMSGCFQQEAPRHATRVATTAAGRVRKVSSRILSSRPEHYLSDAVASPALRL